MIISASRRTDIPAFYHRWFMNRIREGFLLTRNPFNASQIKRVSLEPQHVDAIVFWTRNAEPLIKHLPKLSEFNYYFQYTITGYPKALEGHLPNIYQSIETFVRLSDIIGPSKIRRECFAILYNQKYLGTNGDTQDERYENFYQHYRSDIGHYFRHVYQIINFIDTSTVENKKQYSNFIRAQLSDYELVLLFINGLSIHGRDKMKPLIENYELFEHLSINLIQIGVEQVSSYDISAFGKSSDTETIKYLFV